MSFAFAAAAFTMPVSTLQPPFHYPLIHQVICRPVPGKRLRGTAFRVGPNKMLSVAHVTSTENCEVAGSPFVATPEPGLDFSVIDTPVHKLGAMKVNCGGFKPGGWYYATGFAYGHSWQRTMLLRASSVMDDTGMHILFGPEAVIPGMSGGPIVDAFTGEVVGTINANVKTFGMSFSRPLKDTSLCNS